METVQSRSNICCCCCCSLTVVVWHSHDTNTMGSAVVWLQCGNISLDNCDNYYLTAVGCCQIDSSPSWHRHRPNIYIWWCWAKCLQSESWTKRERERERERGEMSCLTLTGSPTPPPPHILCLKFFNIQQQIVNISDIMHHSRHN